MLLNRTWNKKNQELTISYINKQGQREFFKKSFHHIKTYEYDPNGEYETWNGQRCNKVYKSTEGNNPYTPNEFDILEFMYELPEETNKLLHAQYFPKIYFFDIETETSNEFPEPTEAKFKVTAISIVGPDLSCIVYGLHDMSEESKELFKKRYLDWIKENEFATKFLAGKEPKVLYKYFATEEEMLEHFFTKIVPKIAVLVGWNAYRFDWLYLVTRLKVLFGEQKMRELVRKSSPTGETKKIMWQEQDGTRGEVLGPCHSEIFDYMEIVKKYDRVIAPTAESFSLDWIGGAAVNAHKIKYEGTLQQLYERDPEWYYFYNAIDSLIGMLIHYKLKAIESPCAVSSITLVSLRDSFGQVALTTANVFEEFYKDNKRVVYDYDAIERTKIEYEGAFCGCVPGRYEWNVCDDFASLYPSQIQTCNLSFENFVHPPMVGPDSFGRYTPRKWTEEELETYRNDPNYFVSVMGNVYKNDKDYAFKKMQRRIKQNRDFYKYTGQRLESELLEEINRLIEEKQAA